VLLDMVSASGFLANSLSLPKTPFFKSGHVFRSRIEVLREAVERFYVGHSI